jgi:hypothetical protein
MDDEDEQGQLKNRPEVKNTAYWLGEKIAELSRQFKYNFFFRLTIQIYLELCIVSFIGAKGMSFENPIQIISSILAIVGLLIVFGFLIWLPIFALKSYAKMRIMGKRFVNKYYALFGDYKEKGFKFLFYTFFFIFRRFLLAIVLVFLRNYIIV